MAGIDQQNILKYMVGTNTTPLNSFIDKFIPLV